LCSRGLVVGGARACALRVAVRCDARVEAGARGLAAGRARASFAMGLRNRPTRPKVISRLFSFRSPGFQQLVKL